MAETSHICIRKGGKGLICLNEPEIIPRSYTEKNANALVEFKSEICFGSRGKPGPSVVLFIVSYTLN